MKFSLNFLSNLFNDSSVSFRNSAIFQFHRLCKIFMKSTENFRGIFLTFLRTSPFYQIIFKISLKFSKNLHESFLRIFSKIPRNYLDSQVVNSHSFSINFVYILNWQNLLKLPQIFSKIFSKLSRIIQQKFWTFPVNFTGKFFIYFNYWKFLILCEHFVQHLSISNKFSKYFFENHRIFVNLLINLKKIFSNFSRNFIKRFRNLPISKNFSRIFHPF